MATERLLPAFVDETHCEYKSVDSGHPLSTAFGCDENAETYARFYMVNGGGASTKVLYGFDLSAIPDNAEIGSVSAKIKGRMQNGSILRGGNNTVALCENDTNVIRSESTTVFGTSASVAKLQTVDFTRERLNNLRVKFHGSRGYIGTSTSYYMDFFGCSVTVEFTVPEQPGEYFMLKVGGAWVKGAAIYKKIGGVWVQQTDISAAFDSGVKYRKPE